MISSKLPDFCSLVIATVGAFALVAALRGWKTLNDRYWQLWRTPSCIGRCGATPGHPRRRAPLGAPCHNRTPSHP